MRKILPYDRDYQIIETMKWMPPGEETGFSGRERGYFLLERHVERMADAALHAGFRFDSARLRRRLLETASGFENRPYRVRALLHFDGRLDVSFAPLDETPGRVIVGMSTHQVDSSDPFLYFKTTRRAPFDEEHARAVARGWFDVIFTNERGEVTEGAISTIFARQADGRLLTPPVSSGLLPGTLRQSLIDASVAVEQVLYPDDLKNAETVYAGNSVRGLVEAGLAE
jgi:branched-subunit amino acid aminotransferase/4-amino-4-deoxychorismate lyase